MKHTYTHCACKHAASYCYNYYYNSRVIQSTSRAVCKESGLLEEGGICTAAGSSELTLTKNHNHIFVHKTDVLELTYNKHMKNLCT